MVMVPRLTAFVGVVAAASLLSACATAKAAAESPMPVMSPPDVPPRIVAEYEPDPPLPAAPVSAEAVTPPPRPAARPLRREPVRAETPPEDTQGPPVPQAPQPALALQTGAGARADQSVRALLAQAAVDLNRVDYRALDADGRAQYDTAKRFMAQADEALRARNLAYAGKLADKAATMASVLVR